MICVDGDDKPPSHDDKAQQGLVWAALWYLRS